MRGKHVSRPKHEILKEAHRLAEQGVRELVVIGQDTTYYGLDLDGTRALPGLLESLADLPGIEWVRLMYAFPARFPLEVLDVIARHPHLCKYIDMPLQHVADPVLKSMRRGISQRGLRDLVGTIRERVTGVALRTSLIVGYPTEGEAEFKQLLDFVREARFDRLGIFTYSQEEGTTAHEFGDPVPEAEKERRRSVLMELQQEISLERNEALIGRRMKVLLEREEAGYFVGRTEYDAPEIDNEVFVRTTQSPAPGTFHEVDIVEAYEYDIFATMEEDGSGRNP
jgi:ribosomal protein S12 methylthiotransferase